MSKQDENKAVVGRWFTEFWGKTVNLGGAAGLSPGYFHRIFKAATGLTPKSYAAEFRARKVREGLVSCHSVTEAMYDAGFNSTGASTKNQWGCSA